MSRAKRAHFIDNDFVLNEYVSGVKLAEGLTQLVPLQSYRYRERNSWTRLSVSAIVYAFAMYGFYQLIAGPIFYFVFEPFVVRFWWWLSA
jgi:hypothetical protein